MNEIARAAIADKLSSAIKREGLTKTEAADLLGTKPELIRRLLNPKYRGTLTDYFFENFAKWGNSGLSIREWAKKYNPGAIEPAPKDSVVKDRIIPIAAEKVLTKAQQDMIQVEQSIKTVGGISLKEISKLFDEKFANQPEVFLATTEKTESRDRLEIILEVIEEIKKMGFDIDISISPK